jgi:quercetin dioxygenase-like cupin family protein
VKKQGKVWGETARIFIGNNVEMHRIVGKKGGYCSKHAHEHKYNMFFCEQGVLKIIEWKEDSGTVDVTFLKNCDSCVVPPGSYHKFEVVEDCVAYEIYWVTLESSDINREDHGGARKPKK